MALAGAWAHRQGQLPRAVELLQAAATPPGTEYDAYSLLLARALAANHDNRAARAAANKVAGKVAPVDFKLEQEPERIAAAKFLQQLGG